MMKACGKYLTLFLSVLVLLTTTLQFHHHDCHGSIFFPLSFEKDIVIDADDGIVALDDCPHHYKEGASHAPDCKGHKKCSMHIDQSDISRQYLTFLFFPVISNLYKLDFRIYEWFRLFFTAPVVNNPGIFYFSRSPFHEFMILEI